MLAAVRTRCIPSLVSRASHGARPIRMIARTTHLDEAHRRHTVPFQDCEQALRGAERALAGGNLADPRQVVDGDGDLQWTGIMLVEDRSASRA